MLIHGVAVFALLHIRQGIMVTPQQIVIADITPQKPRPVDVLPLPLPRLAPPPMIRVVPPIVTIAQPPAPNAIAATTAPPPPQQPARQQAQGQHAAGSPPPDYVALLMAHLNAYKRYPFDAQRQRQQGTVHLRFKMNRDGHVLSYEVTGSSGFPALDQEARDMIQRAQPLPPVPPGYPGTVLDLVVPIVFSLR